MIPLTLVAAASLTAANPSSIAAMQWKKRVLLDSASDANDPRLKEQRRIIAHWKTGASERDLTIVQVVGDTVTGANDVAAELRQRYKLPTTGFMVALIGKDGGIKLREKRAITSATLEATIDAMPMRRSGGR